jgi:hypothetical protein
MMLFVLAMTTMTQQTPDWQCTHADGSACLPGDMLNPWYRQVLILATGFQATDEAAFFTDFGTTVNLITSADSAGAIWSVQKSNQLLFVGAFTVGGPLGDTAAFAGKVFPHPIRGWATTLDQDAVYTEVAQLQSEVPGLHPFSTAVMFNSFQTGVTANAAPPSFVNKPFGVAKYTREDLLERGAYVPGHELAHAGLNYLDEYVEPGFENLNIAQLDILTPLILLDDSWSGLGDAIDSALGLYTFRMSEVLAENGNDNIATSEYPASVIGAGYLAQDYEWEGGMFFGRGTWHMPGNNLMNDSDVVRGPGDAFGWGHSPSQQQSIDEAFGGAVPRPNDRLRTAGPNVDWLPHFGTTTNVMLFDGDKLHHFHPTQSYTVQVTWAERHWSVCWAFIIPYPCHQDEWQTAQTDVGADERSVEIQVSAAYGVANLLQRLICAVGFTEIKTNSADIRLCDEDLSTMANAFLPTFVFRMPYQTVPVPATQWMTQYYWRFQSHNGAYDSAFTGWSGFYRGL